MFRITEELSSESLVQCLAKNYKNESIVFVDMDRVGITSQMKHQLDATLCRFYFCRVTVHSVASSWCFI